jgi:hypothetical protein
VLDVPGDGTLETGEREVVAVLVEVAAGQGPRERDRRGVAVARDAVDVRATGIGQAEQAGDLVERLTRRVVDRLAEQRDAGDDVVDEQDLGVPAADQQCDDPLVEAAVL